MKMQALSGGRLQMKRRTYFPDAPRDETIDLPVMSFLIRHRQANVLFDTGCHPSALRDPVGRWRGLAKLIKPICDPDDNLILLSQKTSESKSRGPPPRRISYGLGFVHQRGLGWISNR